MIYLLIIIGFLLIEYIIGLWINHLNLNSMSNKIPEDFSGVIDENKYEKSQEYNRSNTYFDNLTSTFNFAFLLLIILGGGFNLLDQFIRSYSINSEITLGILFFFIFFIINDIISVPFQYYKTFRIEERFGFNKMTIRLFLMDKIKSYFLIAMIGGPIIALVIFFFQSYPVYGWFYVWIFLSFISILIQPLFVTYISPLFNKFSPLSEGTLKDKITNYLKRVNFPIASIDVMDGSIRSTHSNAYFSGLGPRKRIALFDTLLDNHSEDEILSIIAHEVGHYKKKHIIKNMMISIIYSGILLFILSYFLNNPLLFSAFNMQETSIYASLIFFSILYSPIDFLFSIFIKKLSRNHEFEADQFSIDTYGNKDSLINALKVLAVTNLGNLKPHPMAVIFYYTHPPVIDRIKNILSN